MSRLRARTLVLALTVILSTGTFLRVGILPTIIVMMAGVTAAVLAGRLQAGLFKIRRKAAGRPGWRPTVQHQELPPPADDPVIGFSEPAIDAFSSRTPPLAHLQLSATVRSELDGFALGRAKRIVEAPDLLPHAAADAESWPFVEAAVQRALAVARARGVGLRPEGQTQIQRALALSASQGVLLAEWRQLDDGTTVWDGGSARIRASDAFTIHRVTESMERSQLPDVFAGIARRPTDFDVRLLLPYAMATAFYLRLRGTPPTAFAA